jgi:hypothetical protein
MLDSLITSKTRIKLLTRLFLNSNSYGHLRGLQTEFGESSNAIRLELNRFEQAGLIISHNEANRKVYAANTAHPLFPEINSILRKHLGLDQLIENVIERLGKVEKVFLTGDFAIGKESQSIEMILVGDDLNVEYLNKLIDKSQKLIKRSIYYSIFNALEIKNRLAELNSEEILLLWKRNE